MPNTYTQIHIHVVFAVKNRQSLIRKEWKIELYKYITGIIQNQNHKVLAIKGVSDHIHILIGLRPAQSLADLMRHVKTDSTKWVKENFSKSFSWQEGYGAFSISKSRLKATIEYIEDQEKHHQKKTFLEEYKAFLAVNEISYDEKYLFQAV